MAATSCVKDDDEIVVDEVWKENNRIAFLNISANSEYREIKSEGNNGSVYVKELKKGTGTEPIYYNSRVKVCYTGWFIDEAVFDSVELPYDNPVTFSVSTGLIEGWTVALQHMKVGDRWEVWIPYTLAYGESGNVNQYTGVVTIPPYSTLKFEIEVVAIAER